MSIPETTRTMELFSLNENEIKARDKFREALKEIYGDAGDFEYIFSPGGGIGTTVTVRSIKHGIEKNITDYESW
jgi:hypothetical protein